MFPTVFSMILMLIDLVNTGSLYPKNVLHDDVLLDRKIYRLVGDYQTLRPQSDTEESRWSWLLNPLIKLWRRLHRDDHNSENGRESKSKFSFLSKQRFKPRKGLPLDSVNHSLTPYKPKYKFKTKQEEFFSKRRN